jgi:predicted porin
MRNILKLVAIAIVGLVVLTGCRTATVYNVMDNPVDIKKSVSDDKMYKAIKKAGLGLGWQITKVKPGLAQGQLNIRDHMATVEIPYNQDSFSITYKNSLNLNYDASKNTIHSNYNGWVQNLSNAISLQLSALEM